MSDRHVSDGRVSGSSSAIIAALALAGLVTSMSQTILVPVIPDMPGVLGVSADDASWLITATVLASVAGTPSVSRLADMFGKRRMLLIVILLNILGSLLGIVSTSLWLLIVARFLQGFGLALIPIGLSIMRDELPRERLPFGVAMLGATIGVGGAFALPMSGVIFQHLGWHALFIIPAAVATVVAIIIVRVVPESTVRTGGRFDLPGAVVLSVGMLSILLGITKGGAWGWTSTSTLLAFVVGVVLLAGWIPWELRARHPLVELRTSVRRPVLMTNLSALLVSFAMYCNLITTTQQLQVSSDADWGFGLDAAGAGLALLPASLVGAALAPCAAWLITRIGPRATLLIGTAILAAAYGVRVVATSSEWQVIVGSCLVAIGTALPLSTFPLLIMRSVPITETAAANGVNYVIRAVGTSTASAAVAAILTTNVVTVNGRPVSELLGFQFIFVLAGIASVLALLASWWIPATPPTRRDPAIVERPTPAQTVVHGVVIDEAGQSITHAVVAVSTVTGRPVDWAPTDGDGAFNVVVPEPGRYLVSASADGHEPEAVEADVRTGMSPLQVKLPSVLETR